MLIDWFTVGAQALNFIILVWLLRRFLYKPVLKAIDAREKKITGELADAAAKEAEAHKERDEFQRKNMELDQQRAALLRKATDEANAERERLLDDARKAAEAFGDKRREALRSEAENLNRAVGRRAQEEVFAIARKALTDLATASLEERMVGVFIRRLGGLNGPAKASLADAIRKTPDNVIVRSAFDLPEAQRATVQDALNRAFSAEVHLRFETAPDLVGGIELATTGHKLSWSIAGYLGSLEKGIAELLKEREMTATTAEVKSTPEQRSAAQPGPEPKPATKSSPKSEAKPEPNAVAEREAKSA